ncbi:unnamed protein product [Clonostachys rosea f. rosea IK726]|uniref:Uncharacterized protein n=1 Tax=Clonostachys rosea f. rosea IK726 TaxID=1349383 RepID=A0ACA9U6V2_BIOOC|nr:unnamed protein product [Clonostachys rosea f. rosea IK726]
MDVRSKWDRDDLSDDSDTDLHPHIDARSLIWKHQERARNARHELKVKIGDRLYEKMVREKVVNWLSLIESDLEAQFDEKMDSQEASNRVSSSISANVHDSEGTRPRPRASNGKYLCSYTDMFHDAVNAGLEKANGTVIYPESWMRVYITELSAQKQNIQQQLVGVTEQLAQLEEEDAEYRKYEGYQIQFGNSIIFKNDAGPYAPWESQNTGALPDEQDLEAAQPSLLASHFAHIHPSRYHSSYEFIKAHPTVLHASEVDGLMAHAFNIARFLDDDKRVQGYVHQASVLQYCLELGTNGAEIFFRAMSRPKSKAHVGFQREVFDKLMRLLELADISREYLEGINMRVIVKIHMEPNTTFIINAPKLDSGDEDEQERRSIFEKFSDDMKAAIQSGSLDKINEVLGAMPREEAEVVRTLIFETDCIKVQKTVPEAATELQ